MIICAVYDKKSKLYEQPFFAQNASHAVRGFAAEIMKSGSPFNMFADDFELHQIGYWENNFTKNKKTEPLPGKGNVELVLEIEITKPAEFRNIEPQVLAIGSAFKTTSEKN